MGNALSSEPPQLYARPAPSTATAATHTEVATLELLASAYPPLHAREVEP
eukprot:COSAG03_NODE_18236_length_359_cov_0.715385_1_plen_49_part_10